MNPSPPQVSGDKMWEGLLLQGGLGRQRLLEPHAYAMMSDYSENILSPPKWRQDLIGMGTQV